MDLHQLTPDDWKTWRALRLEALTEAPYAFGSTLADWQGDGDREERWRARLDMPGLHLVALLDAEPVGMASGIPGSADGVAEVSSMWVSPVARGRGVGDRLLDALSGWAWSVHPPRR